MLLRFIPLLQEVIPALPDSVPTVKEEIGMLKSLPFDELVNRFVSGVVTLAINLLIAAIVFYAGKFIINKIYGIVTRIMLRRRVDVSLTTFVLSFIRIVLYFILIVTVIGILGIETSSFLALFASAGVAIGMALSGTLQNFAGGVLILLLKPYRVGDYIEAMGFAGTVKEIQIFSTIITTPDNKSIIIPNGGLSTGSINNYSREDYRRVDWSVGISYGDDVDTAREAILAMLRSDVRVVAQYTDEPIHEGQERTDRSPSVVVDQLADSAVVLKVKAWTQSSNYWGLYHDMNERFYKELPGAGINFPFPQLDVHLPDAPLDKLQKKNDI